MQDVDTFFCLIREGRDYDALELLNSFPELAAAHSDESGQLHGASAPHWATHRNAAALCERLIELGASMKESASDWWLTPLAWGADAGRAEAVECLLTHGVNVNQDAGLGASALHAVAQGGSSGGSRNPLAYQRTAELLIAYGADVNRRATRDRGQTPLDDAIANRNDWVAAAFREHGAQVSNPRSGESA